GWAGKLGATHLIRITAKVEVHHHGGHTFGIACPGVPWLPLVVYNWHGTVAVTAQLWDVEQGCSVGSRTAESGFWGSVANLPCIFVGHAVWKTFARGSDEALRRVLDELFLEAARTHE
ncbi:MAG: hypothetical protein JNM56_20085, partial [Planctomycetia bacterium]|nr:hypothetical protein [Planctomycetia bacterium]